MLTVHGPGTFRKIRDDHICNPKIIDTHGSCGDVQDRIDSADLMKMYLFDRFSMHLRLSFGNDPEYPESQGECVFR